MLYGLQQRGKMPDGYVYYVRGSEQLRRIYTKPTDPNTVVQRRYRAGFALPAGFPSAWQRLGEWAQIAKAMRDTNGNKARYSWPCALVVARYRLAQDDPNAAGMATHPLAARINAILYGGTPNYYLCMPFTGGFDIGEFFPVVAGRYTGQLVSYDYTNPTPADPILPDGTYTPSTINPTVGYNIIFRRFGRIVGIYRY
jgi:hypothetical protein